MASEWALTADLQLKVSVRFDRQEESKHKVRKSSSSKNVLSQLLAGQM